MIVVYCAVAAVAIWCLVKSISGPAVRLEKVDRARNEFVRTAAPLLNDEELFPEHNVLLVYMADNIANPDLPLDVLANVMSGGFRQEFKAPSALSRDLIVAHDLLTRTRPDMAARVEKAANAFVRAITGQVPAIGGLCRFFLLRHRRIDLMVPGLVAAYEATKQAPAKRISQELSAT